MGLAARAIQPGGGWRRPASLLCAAIALVATHSAAGQATVQATRLPEAHVLYSHSSWDHSFCTQPPILGETQNPKALAECTAVNLSSTGLRDVPEWLQEAVSLQELDLSNNELTRLPEFLGQLINLRLLDVHGNSLTGPVPPFVGFQFLEKLDLSDNHLSSHLPDLSSLTSLKLLDLSNNSLSGPLPPTWGQLRNLSTLRLWGNQLSGQIPPQLGQLALLQELRLSQNSLCGFVPAELGSLSQLLILELFGNELSGPIPAQLAQLTLLQVLTLSQNSLSGSIPPELGQLGHLSILELFSNKLEGQIPAELGSLSNVTKLTLWGNELTGSIPEQLGHLHLLTDLMLHKNKLTGPLPESLGQLTQLRNLGLAENNLNGTIPEALGNLQQLHTLQLQSNSLSGEIPSSLQRLQLLFGLHLAGNKLWGTIPGALGKLGNLRYLYLGNNSLQGRIPDELTNLTLLQVLDLSSNKLSGDVPMGIWQLPNLANLMLGSNKLSGRLPQELFKARQLKRLSLSENLFQGTLPSSLGSMLALETLDVSMLPGLYGTFPDTSTLLNLTTVQAASCSFTKTLQWSPSLQILDLSSNRLTALPEGLRSHKRLLVLKLESNFISEWPLAGVATRPCSSRTWQPRFYWPQLQELVVSSNPLRMEVQPFIDSLSYLPSLTGLRCTNCSLHGILTDFEVEKEAGICPDVTRPWIGFKNLHWLNLGLNKIGKILPCPPTSLEGAIFNKNDLRSIPSCWLFPKGSLRRGDLTGNKELHSAVDFGRSCQGATGLVADPDRFQQVNSSTVAECTSLCATTGATGQGLRVDGDFFNSSIMCRCKPGYKGHGLDCQKCLENTDWVVRTSSSGTWATCPCSVNFYLEEGLCSPCPLFTGTNGLTGSVGSNSCRTQQSPRIVALQVAVILLWAIAFCFLPISFSLPPMVIADVSLVEGKLLLTTNVPQYILRWAWRPVPVQLSGTGHPCLDKNSRLFAKRLGSFQLGLCFAGGEAISKAWETSQGFLRVRLPFALFFCGLGSVPALALSVGLTFLASWLVNLTHAPLPVALAQLALSSALALCIHSLMWSHALQTPLEKQRAVFKASLLKHHRGLRACPSGSGRAITAQQLGEFFEYFQTFIRGRDMYYVASNIVEPLTASHQLSFSELVGPSEVTFFVSHFWGGSFQHFVAAVLKHARSCEHWHEQSYWICTFSNNQWQVSAELGSGKWQDSSFFKALRSPQCLGTLMILDREAMPLRRAWCLFEVLQTLLLSGTRPDFKGLLLGTEAGVLNTGNGSMDVALGLAERLTTLDLRDAEATSTHDLSMIHHLVESTHGGFDTVNSFVRLAIEDALQVMHEAFSHNVQNVRAMLRSNSVPLEKGVALRRAMSQPQEEEVEVVSECTTSDSAVTTLKPPLPPHQGHANCHQRCRLNSWVFVLSVVLFAASAAAVGVTWTEWLWT